MISIQTNVNSLVAQQNLSVNSAFQSKTISQLTSGYRINQSGDDAAGLAVANKFRSSVAELTQGVANGNDAVAQLQIMDGGMSNISQILDRLKTLATQSASGTFTGNRSTLNDEFQNDVSEIDRQAQSIGLNTGGTFAKNLSVFLGQGSGSASLSNAQVGVDLSHATVDAQSLGLKGMQAVVGTSDLGASSATSVSNILANTVNNGNKTITTATFDFSGPGFAAKDTQVSVNLNGVSDIASLVKNINSAIQKTADGPTQANAAFKAAGVVASIHTDASGGQQVAFTSNSTAFQVQAGDQMSNALMGNFSTGSTGASLNTAITGQAVSGSFLTGQVLNLKIAGGGLSAPKELTYTTATADGLSADVVFGKLKDLVAANDDLKQAGITAAKDATTGQISFTSALNSKFSVELAGDTKNVLGLGAFVAKAGAADYTSITAGAAYVNTTTGAAPQATFEISVTGGPSIHLDPIALDGGDATKASITSGAMADTTITASNNVLNFKVDGHAITTTLAVDTVATAAVATATTSKASATNITFLDNVVPATAAAMTASAGAVGIAFQSANFQFATDGAKDLNITLGSTTHNVILTGDDSSFASLKADLQNAIDAQFTPGDILVGDDGSGHLTLTDNSGVTGVASHLSIAAGTVDDASSLLGFDLNDHGDGTASSTPVKAGHILVNLGGTGPKDVQLTGTGGLGTDTDIDALVADLQAGLNGAGLGAITADKDATGHITLTTTGTGAAATIEIGAAAGDSSTMGKLGFAGTAGELVQGTDATKTTLAAIAQKMQDAIDLAKTDPTGSLYGTGSSATVSVASGKIAITNDQAGASHSIGIVSGNGTTAGAKSFDLTGDALTNSTGAGVNVAANGVNRTLDNLKTAINEQIGGNSTLQSLGFQASVQNVSGTDYLQISNTSSTGFRLNAGASSAKGEVIGTKDLSSGADFSSAPMTLNVKIDGAATATTVTLNQKYTAAQLTATVQSQLGAGANVTLASLNGKNYLKIASANATPASGSVQVLATGTANQALGLTDSTKHTGANEINSGFGVSNSSSAGNMAVTAASSALSVVNAGGTAQTGALSFVNMKGATSTQAITVSGNDTAGGMQAVTVTLAAKGAGTAALGNESSGDDIDQAVAYINKQLQATNNPTLQKIVAVKQSVAGDEAINFIGGGSFQVSVGTAFDASGKGAGLNGGVAKTADAAMSGASNSIAVDTQDGAKNAINTLVAAVGKLGTAQAAIGRGENQLTYAISLATSQITNFSAAESQIRDANVAQQAANLSKAQTLSQASIAAMAQANSAPQAVLSLLRG